jgi:hypothetical protein
MIIFAYQLTNKMEKEKEALIDKIRKLLEKSESAKSLGSQAEAEAFAMKAQQLMFDYQIEAEEVRKASGGKFKMKQAIINFEALTNRHESDWVDKLIRSLARGNLCLAVGLSYGAPSVYDNPSDWREGDIWIGGQPENIEMTQYMLDQLLSRARIMAKESFKKYSGDEKRNTYIRGFLRGFALGIGEKLMANLSLYQEDTTNPAAIMIVNNNQAVQLYTKSKFPNLSYARSSSLKGRGGLEEGKAVGRSTTLHRGISSSGTATHTKRLG